MSRRTAECNKAIQIAWNKEQELVREGKGTREWTQQQQKDILEKGKAYDENGLAFQGQHMKSAETYPEYQGDPGNIQFLTRAEHLDAHNGNWRNPTNWYYNPMTKEKIDFGDGPYIPCKIIELQDRPLPVPESISNLEDQATENNAKLNEGDNVSIQKEEIGQNKIKKKSIFEKIQMGKAKLQNKVVGAWHVVKTIDPALILTVAACTIDAIVKIGCAVESFKKPSVDTLNQKKFNVANEDITKKGIDMNTLDQAIRSSPCENDVIGHRQRYHTSEGIKWIEKQPYHRGGNHN